MSYWPARELVEACFVESLAARGHRGVGQVNTSVSLAALIGDMHARSSRSCRGLGAAERGGDDGVPARRWLQRSTWVRRGAGGSPAAGRRVEEHGRRLVVLVADRHRVRRSQPGRRSRRGRRSCRAAVRPGSNCRLWLTWNAPSTRTPLTIDELAVRRRRALCARRNRPRSASGRPPRASPGASNGARSTCRWCRRRSSGSGKRSTGMSSEPTPAWPCSCRRPGRRNSPSCRAFRRAARTKHRDVVTVPLKRTVTSMFGADLGDVERGKPRRDGHRAFLGPCGASSRVDSHDAEVHRRSGRQRCRAGFPPRPRRSPASPV